MPCIITLHAGVPNAPLIGSCREKFEALRNSCKSPPAELLSFPQLLCTSCDQEEELETVTRRERLQSQEGPDSPRASGRSSNGWIDGKRTGGHPSDDSRVSVLGPTEGRPGRLLAPGTAANHAARDDMRTSLLVPANRSSSGISDDTSQPQAAGAWTTRKGRSSSAQVWRRGPAAGGDGPPPRPALRSGGHAPAAHARCVLCFSVVM